MPPRKETVLTMQTVSERLKNRGLRMTRSRERVIDTLLAADRPLSADDIRQRGDFLPSDLVTIYRNTEALEAAGVLQRILMENGTQLFEITAPDEHYHHLICRDCHRTERLDVCLDHAVEAEARAKGFTIGSHHLEVYGFCESCAPRH